MSIARQAILISQNPNSYHLPPRFTKSSECQNPLPTSRIGFPNCRFFTTQSRLLAVATKTKAVYYEEPYISSPDQINESSSSRFDAFLSTFEFVSLASSAAVAVYVAAKCGIQKGGDFGWLGSRFLVWQCVVLVGGLVAGSILRHRQWQRVCGGGYSRGSASSCVNLLERVEKLEEDLHSSKTIVQALSRRLEKLGIRFRVTRKSLKDPIAETAALVKRNSEATQALAAQEDILEKELGEIQKVLLAMQDQQQKQLELILAIGKAGKLWEPKQAKTQEQKAPDSSKFPVGGGANTKVNEIKTLELQKEANID